MALTAAQLAFREDEPLLKKTWWRVGGAADGYLELTESAQLQAVQRIVAETQCPLFVLGNASNLLIADAGIRGLVVRLTGRLTESTEEQGQVLRCGGGLKLVALVRRMRRAQWTGLEHFAGIPGTVGGAVRMNAGTRLGETGDRLIEAGVVHRGGDVQVMLHSAMHFAYRTSAVRDDSIVAWARFQLSDDDPATSESLIVEHLAHRARTQPIEVPTCGSTFRNPEGHHAGRLIEQAGLKGLMIGRAQVSPKHANFIVNLGGASAVDIRRLIERVQRDVWDQHSVLLEREVHYAGDWGEWDPDRTL